MRRLRVMALKRMPVSSAKSLRGFVIEKYRHKQILAAVIDRI